MSRHLFTTSWAKDKNGKIILFQPPNIPIISWFVLTIIGKFLHEGSTLHDVISVVAFGSLFTWAWLEVSSGVTRLRRLLGAAVIVFSVMNFIDKL